MTFELLSSCDKRVFCVHKLSRLCNDAKHFNVVSKFHLYVIASNGCHLLLQAERVCELMRSWARKKYRRSSVRLF